MLTELGPGFQELDGHNEGSIDRTCGPSRPEGLAG